MTQSVPLKHCDLAEAAPTMATGTVRRTFVFVAVSCLAAFLVLVGWLGVGYVGHFVPSLRPLVFVWTFVGLFLIGAASSATLGRGIKTTVAFGIGFVLAGLAMPSTLILCDRLVTTQLGPSTRLMAVMLPSWAVALAAAGGVGMLPVLLPNRGLILTNVFGFALIGCLGGLVATLPCVMQMGQSAIMAGALMGCAICLLVGGLACTVLCDRAKGTSGDI